MLRPTVIALCLILLVAHRPGSAQGYWDVEIPIMPSAKDIQLMRNGLFSTITLTYSLTVSDIAAVRDFYAEFFDSLGWSDPLAQINAPGNARFTSSGGWHNFQMNVSETGEPAIQYSSTWTSIDPSANGTVSLRLNGADDDEYPGTVFVQLSPQIPLTAQYMMELQQLFISDPRVFFAIHEMTEADPFNVWEINRDSLAEYSGSDASVLSYIALIAEIDQLFESYSQALTQ